MCVGQKSLIDSRDVTHIVVHKELPDRKAAQIGKSDKKGTKKVVHVDCEFTCAFSDRAKLIQVRVGVLDCIARATKRGEETCTTTKLQVGNVRTSTLHRAEKVIIGAGIAGWGIPTPQSGTRFFRFFECSKGF